MQSSPCIYIYKNILLKIDVSILYSVKEGQGCYINFNLIEINWNHKLFKY